VVRSQDFSDVGCFILENVNENIGLNGSGVRVGSFLFFSVLIITVLLDDTVTIIIESVRLGLVIITFLIFLLLFFNVMLNYLVKYNQAAVFARFCAFIESSGCKIDNFLKIFSLVDDVVELFDLKHVSEDGASVQVVLV